MTTSNELMTAEEMEALRQKVAGLNLPEACVLINSMAEDEECKELMPFIICNLAPAVVVAMAQTALDSLTRIGVNNE